MLSLLLSVQHSGQQTTYGDSWIDMNHGGTKGLAHVLFAVIGGLLSLITAILYAKQLIDIKLPKDKPVTISVSELVAKGADAFLRAEYKALSVFVVVVFILLAAMISWQTAICFIVGAFLSAISGYIGMKIATLSNVRTTFASQGDNGLNEGLQVAFKSGAVMALMVVSTGLLGLSSMYMLFKIDDEDKVWEYLSGFAFGGSSIALFARVGGGIYTKAADVGADLVGKVEEELEEDSIDNPATIADNVGDNVGDVAGMGADLFESFVGSIIAAATIGYDNHGVSGIAFPFYVAGFGAIASIIGTKLVRAGKMKEIDYSGCKTDDERKALKAKESEETLEQLLWSIRYAIFGASGIVVVFTIIAAGMCFGLKENIGWNLFCCVIFGLFCGNLIGTATEYATSYTYWPTQSIAQKSDTGSATVIIQGLGIGMLSTVAPVLFIFGTMLASYYVADFYGIAISAVGMLSTLGVTLATDAFGPVADNAGGLASLAPDSEIAEEVRETTDALDALGNTTAATGKGFAIGSAVLTALALLKAFADSAGPKGSPQSVFNLLDPVVLPGVLLGALLPFVFAALTMLSVGKAAESIMWECRDQLNKKYLEGTKLAPEKCVAISTVSSLYEMVAPGTLAVFTPVIVGCMLGTSGLMGLLTGAISSGFLLGVMMSNAGGAWDNAKKYVEKNGLGASKGKKTDNHKATVVGDTVGDPFKDTSGPALNILIKLMSIISLVMGPELSHSAWDPDRWWIGLIFLIVLVVSGVGWYMYLAENGALHDYAAIEKASIERKALIAAEDGNAPKKAAAPAAEEEEEKKQEEEEAAAPAVDKPEIAETADETAETQ